MFDRSTFTHFHRGNFKSVFLNQVILLYFTGAANGTSEPLTALELDDCTRALAEGVDDNAPFAVVEEDDAADTLGAAVGRAFGWLLLRRFSILPLMKASN